MAPEGFHTLATAFGDFRKKKT